MVIIDGIIFSLQKYGGISATFHELIKRMKGASLSYEVLCYNETENSKELYHYLTKKRFLEQYRNLDLKLKSDQKYILHSSYYRYSTDTRIKNVISIYDFIYEKFEKNLFKRLVHKWQKNSAVCNADAVICNSHHTKKDFLDYYPQFDKKKIFVVHLSFSPDFLNLERSMNKFDNPYVMFVGMRSPHKNFMECVRALSNIDKINLCIVGKDLSANEIKVLNLMIPGRYKHLKNINNTKLSRLYSGAVCLLYPSLYEGFGIPILEAMASGCAVITTNSSSMPEVAGEAAILLDDPTSYYIQESINFLLDATKNRSYVELGYKNIQRFSWDRAAEETVEVYRSVFKEK